MTKIAAPQVKGPAADGISAWVELCCYCWSASFSVASLFRSSPESPPPFQELIRRWVAPFNSRQEQTSYILYPYLLYPYLKMLRKPGNEAVALWDKTSFATSACMPN